MILGDKREQVIENISKAAESGDFHIKVEVGDPVLTPEESAQIIQGYLDNSDKMRFKTKSYFARKMANILTKSLNKDTEIKGLENIADLEGGAIITSNHFSPLDNTAVRFLTRKLKKKRINIVSQETNLAMPGIVGFLMNYADIIPISDNKHYMQRDFYSILQELLENDEYILIYPEQEMWFNYRKPRPLKRGAYYYAAKLGVPVVSCFVEMQNLPEIDTEGFYKVKYTVHILPTIYPDKTKSVKENSIEMCRLDYEQKKEAYEKAYGKPLDYRFEEDDIAGWMGTKQGRHTA
ncbi:MAG: 1-acyl-sn-glycerol-3-phosphate acyltransferase [Clostridia bacterium]|nr:1-acyl-sn-glycerol-3-phosphate acyltransferase [Clostridia bacterium]